MIFLQKIKKISQIELSKRDFYIYFMFENDIISKLNYDELPIALKSKTVYCCPRVGLGYSLEMSGFEVKDFAGKLSLSLTMDCTFKLGENNDALRDFILRLELANPSKEWDSKEIFDFVFKDYESKIRAFLNNEIQGVKAHMLMKYQGEAVLTKELLHKLMENLPPFLKIEYKSLNFNFAKDNNEEPENEESAKGGCFAKSIIILLFLLSIIACLGGAAYFYAPELSKYFEKTKAAEQLIEEITALADPTELIAQIKPAVKPTQAEPVKAEPVKAEPAKPSTQTKPVEPAPARPSVAQAKEIDYSMQIYLPKSMNFKEIYKELKKMEYLLHLETKEIIGFMDSKILELSFSSKMTIGDLEKTIIKDLSKELKELNNSNVKIQ